VAHTRGSPVRRYALPGIAQGPEPHRAVTVCIRRDHQRSRRRGNRTSLTWVLSPFAVPSGSYLIGKDVPSHDGGSNTCVCPLTQIS
jgi:hypothetical protein